MNLFCVCVFFFFLLSLSINNSQLKDFSGLTDFYMKYSASQRDRKEGGKRGEFERAGQGEI